MGVSKAFLVRTALTLCWFPLIAGLCLPDGISAADRSYIQDLTNASGAGAVTPIRLVVFDWASADVASALTAIFIREVLGFHASVVPEKAPGSMDGALALAGCGSNDCVQEQFQSHVAMDCWMSEILFNFEQFALANPSVAPIDLGSIGYYGENSLSVKGSVRQEAYESAGLALEFYRSYNASVHRTRAYFDPLPALNRSHFFPCNTTGNEFANDVEMRLYGKWTGDWDGLVETESGYIANCPDGHFWIAPACRHNTSECIPVLAAGNGWIVFVFMQWSAFYGIPAAIGISESWDLFVANVETHRTLFHWWIPDATFHHLDASILQFPRHRAREWAVGKYRTADPQSYIAKLIAKSLSETAPKVKKFLQSFDLDVEDMQALLREVNTGASVNDVACRWQRWEKWVPVDTQCIPGYGLEDVSGNHVPNRSAAASCSVCLAGSFSEPFSDDFGQTHRCMLCPSGRFQNSFGETSCVACGVGTFALEPGNVYCDRCQLGRYANRSGMTECHLCEGEHQTTSRSVLVGGVEKWIEVDGATSETFCGCLRDWYLNPQGRCEECPFGSSCPGSSQLLLLEGFFATPEEPSQIFRCFGGGSRCPGGAPGSCAWGRDASTVTCDACLPGLQPLERGTCGPCDGTSYMIIVGAFVLVVLGIAFLYAVLALDAERATQPGHLFVIVVALSQLVTTLQQLAVITKFGIVWAEPMAAVMDTFQFMTFDLDRLALSCLTPLTPVAKYSLATSATPVMAMIALFLHMLALAMKRVRSDIEVTLDWSQLVRTVGALFLVLFISLFLAILAPFQCNVHPNGRLTLQDYDSVFCSGQDEHLHMSIIGGLASLMPTFFVALCIRATWIELPKRLLRADAHFVRSCAFLWRRFRPGAEAFAVVSLTRNVLIVLCPLIPAASVQLVMMNIILYLSLVVVAVSQPWRLPACNVLDLWLHVGLLVVLDMASVFAAPDADVATSTMISLVFLFLMALGILAAIVHGIVLQIVRRHRKPWRFFLSHHKRATGGFARLLKIHLQKRSSANTTFLDTDNLRDLTELFTFVKDTETVIVLATPGMLSRKWCVGEIVTARLHNIDTVILKWPTFVYPSDLHRKNLLYAVPGLEALSVYGISLGDVSVTFKWIRTLKALSVPDLIDIGSMSRLCDSLTGTVSNSKETEQDLLTHPDCLILADPSNQEAVATSYILFELLLSVLKGSSLLPLVLQKGEPIPEGVPRYVKALLICSSGCFKSSDLAFWLIQLYELAPVVLPIIAETSFVIPTEPYEDTTASASMNFEDRELYTEMIGQLFQEIGTVFAPQSYSSTQEDLELRVKQICFRLEAKGSRESRARHSSTRSSERSGHNFVDAATRVTSMASLSSSCSEYEFDNVEPHGSSDPVEEDLVSM